MKLNNIYKVAECENHLGLSYLRNGGYDETRNWLTHSLSRQINWRSQTRLQTHQFIALSKLNQQNFKQSLLYHQIHLDSIMKYANQKVKGLYLQNLSYCYRHFGEHDKTLTLLLESRKTFESINSMRVFEVDNALARLFHELQLFDKAHEHVDLAIAGFRYTGDLVRESFSYDTKALICFDEGSISEALIYSERSTESLSQTQEFAIYVNALLTRLRIEFISNQLFAALKTYTKAIDVSRQYLTTQITGKITSCLIELINNKNSEGGFLDLKIPPDIDKDAEIIIINDADYIVCVNAYVKSGDSVVIDFEHQQYFGVLRIDELLGMIALELETGLPLAIGKENKYKLKKVVGIFRKKTGYKFERIT